MAKIDVGSIEGYETLTVEEKLAALDSEEAVLESNKALANKLKNLDMDLGLLSDSQHTSTIVGRIDAVQYFRIYHLAVNHDLKFFPLMIST